MTGRSIRHFCALLFLCYLSGECLSLGIQSRPSFLKVILSAAFLDPQTPDNESFFSSHGTKTFPLLFFRKAGCLGLPLELGRGYSFVAIVDTGSPFLTVPSAARQYTRKEAPTGGRSDSTFEQYCPELGTMTWRLAHVMLSDNDGRAVQYNRQIEVGILSDNIMNGTGGVFFGLIARDLNRPTICEDFQIRSFSLNYPECSLTLSQRSSLLQNDVETHALYNFDRYGTNIHHYGVACDELLFGFHSGKSLRVNKLQRPLVVVVDSGLTGCILDESLAKEMKNLDLSDIAKCQVSFGNTILTSDEKYFNIQSFAVPWFDIDAETHPHVIAVGGTFLLNCNIIVDVKEATIQVAKADQL